VALQLSSLEVGDTKAYSWDAVDYVVSVPILVD